MSLEEFELYEKSRMERNAWYVTTELTKRIDDAPVLSEYNQKKISFIFMNLQLYYGTV